MASSVKVNPRSRSNGAAARMGRRIAPVPTTSTHGEAVHLLEEMRQLTKRRGEGQMEARIPVENFSGVEREIALAVNSLAADSNNVRQQIVEGLKKLAAGNLDVRLQQLEGQDNLITQNMDALREGLRALLEEIHRMCQEHERGDIDVTIPAERFAGAFRAIAENVNQLAGSHIAVKKKAMACVDEFSKGNFDAPLERFAGKKAFINETIERLRANTKSFIAEMQRMSEEHHKGDIDVVIPCERFTGDFRVMAKGVNEMVTGHIEVKKKAMACVAEFAKGNFDAPLERFPGKKAFINENLEQLRGNLKTFIADINRMSDEHNKGDIDARILSDKLVGEFRLMAQGVNDMVAGISRRRRKPWRAWRNLAGATSTHRWSDFPGKKHSSTIPSNRYANTLRT